MKRVRAALAAVCAAFLVTLLVPAVAPAAPKAGDYVCTGVKFRDAMDEVSGTAQQSFYSETTAGCRAGAQNFPNTWLTLSGTATIKCGSGITIVGTLSFADGTNPTVSTSVAILLTRTASGAALLKTGDGHVGALEALMNNGVAFHPPTNDVCGSSGSPVEVSLEGDIAGAGAQPVTQVFGDWTIYDDGDLLTGSVYGLQQGTAVTGGNSDDTTGDCDLPEQSLKLTSGQSVKDLREIAFNPVTCQFLVETGVPSPSVVDAGAKSDASSATQLNDIWSDTASSGQVGLRHSSGYWRTWFEDPARIDVAVAGVGTNWHWSGLIVYPPVSNTVHYHWYDPSGWGLFEHNWQRGYDSTRSTSSVYAHYSNGSWPGCFNHHTHITFNRTRIHGYYNGDLWGFSYARKRGLNIATCLKALHFRHRLQRWEYAI